jgi:predicted nucleotidyltransferase
VSIGVLFSVLRFTLHERRFTHKSSGSVINTTDGANMDDHALIEHIKKSVPSLIALYRFGSHAKGAARLDSDMDLALLARDPIPNIRRFELAQELAAQIHRDVDLVDLRTVSTVMRMQVVSTGECLDASNEPARREFEMYAYSDYTRLNEERREILKKIRESGLVYG